MGIGYDETDIFSPLVLRIIYEQTLMAHGYENSKDVSNMDDTELFIRYTVLQHLIEADRREQDLHLKMMQGG